MWNFKETIILQLMISKNYLTIDKNIKNIWSEIARHFSPKIFLKTQIAKRMSHQKIKLKKRWNWMNYTGEGNLNMIQIILLQIHGIQTLVKKTLRLVMTTRVIRVIEMIMIERPFMSLHLTIINSFVYDMLLE